MSDAKLFSRLSSATGAQVTGELKNGKWRLWFKKHYAVMLPFAARRFEHDEVPDPTGYYKMVIETGATVDFYTMRDEFETVVSAIKTHLDNAYLDALQKRGLKGMG